MILSVLLLIVGHAAGADVLVTDDTDEGDRIVGGFYLLLIETVVCMAACVGLLCTSESGGRVLSLCLGTPAIVLALCPPALMWSHSHRLGWHYCPFVLPLVLGCTCIFYGFIKRRTKA